MGRRYSTTGVRRNHCQTAPAQVKTEAITRIALTGFVGQAAWQAPQALHLSGSMIGVSELVENGTESVRHVRACLSQGVQHGHQCLTSPCSRFRLRTKTELSGDDQRPQFSFSQVIIRRHISIAGPVIKPVGLFTKYILYFSDRRVPGLTSNDADIVGAEQPGVTVLAVGSTFRVSGWMR